MKIHILYDFKEGPWGGGNQFLKALKAELDKQGLYEDNPAKAEVILFNSHQQLKRALRLKTKYPQKVFIHRLGPIFHYHRGRAWKSYDKAIIAFANKIADAVVFQSNWSKNEALKIGFNEAIPHKIVYNAVDNTVFSKKEMQGVKLLARGLTGQGKIKLVASSWSDNLQKGFEFYKHLDENLDFSRYEMTFVGNSPVEFRNIKRIPALPPWELAVLLKQNDIFVFAAKNEACSNVLIEAMSCGLPVVALRAGSNPELVEGAGELFDTTEDLLSKIEKVAVDFSGYQAESREFSIEKAAQGYYGFAKSVFEKSKDKGSRRKKPGFWLRFGLKKKLLTGTMKKALKI